jgi:hypothetical protein
VLLEVGPGLRRMPLIDHRFSLPQGSHEPKRPCRWLPALPGLPNDRVHPRRAQIESDVSFESSRAPAAGCSALLDADRLPVPTRLLRPGTRLAAASMPPPDISNSDDDTRTRAPRQPP